MAVTLTRQMSYALGAVVKNRLAGFVASRKQIRDLQEATFQRKVQDEGMSYDVQIAYRKEQLAKERGANVVDESYIKEINDSISNLKKLKRTQDYTNAYMAAFTEYKAHRKTAGQLVEFLNDQLSSVQDDDIKDSIRKSLADAESARYAAEQNILANRVEYAQNDKTEAVINTVISEINDKRAGALLNNDKEAVSKYDTYLSNLNSQLEASKIQKTMHDLEIQNMKTPQTAKSMLEFYANNIKNASDKAIQLKVGDTTYTSAREYWQAKLNGYVQTKFFDAYTQESSDKLTKAAQTLSPVLQKAITDFNNDVDSLRTNEILRPYAERLEQMRTGINFAAVTEMAKKVYDDYLAGRLGKTTTENFNKAQQSLTALNSKYNVDVTQQLNSIVQDYGEKKAAAAQAIMEKTAQYMLPSDKGGLGLDKDAAMKQANIDVPQIDIPEAKIAQMKPVDVAAEAVNQATGAKESNYSLKPQPAPMEQPVKSVVIPKGEQVLYPELMKYLKPEDIVREGEKVYLRQGVKPTYQKVLNPDELRKYTPDQLIRPAGTKDIFVNLR